MRVNIGCGANAPQGWVNIDRSPGIRMARVPGLTTALARARVIGEAQAQAEWPENIRVHDVRRGLPFPTGSVDAVYSSHMLEHLTQQDASALLRECRRILRPDGVLRLALPDLRAAAETYLASDADDAADAFVSTILLGRTDRPRGLHRIAGALSASPHLWMYDARSAVAACKRAGFAEAASLTFQQGRCPDLGTIEHRADSIFIEAYPRSITTTDEQENARA